MALGDTASTNVFSVELGEFQVETVKGVGAPCSSRTAVPSAGDGPGEITITRGAEASTASPSGPQDLLAAGVRSRRSQHHDHSARWEQADGPVPLREGVDSSWQGSTLEAGNVSPATETVTISYEELTIE
ncbi:hypothetical protein [Streptomyces inhibens]|uniref:hypothetical protein n=1 Tax=Streptomyces inhibens TaxID=2293571 RepID=UPI001EE717ED|nr:hypothetical protein [Streptomyces inhibens]UKY47406.1 hypothetical protein KI385_00065 [Streptomyces inhibens]UKY54992.1 hypothetical protein KI385_43825 [Streptomyces inhibens]